MIHHYNHQAFTILVLFTVPFYHFLFSRYLFLTGRHFSSDILVPFPNSSNLYSRVKAVTICDMHKSNMFLQVPGHVGKINFRSKLHLKASKFFDKKLLLRQKGRLKVMGTFKIFWQVEQKFSVTDLKHKHLAT